ncbi:amino acid permease [Corynebacterium glutamicum ATCC 14067]|nr:amino acid permease [Corynebacterium glutamicum ATCC 14067]
MPTWSGPSVVLASLITGMLVSLMLGVIGLPYQLIFIIATLGVTLLVEARGLFLTVASIPILFGIFTPLTSWFVSQQGVAANVSPGVSVTEILTAVYPLAQLFPTLIMVTLVAALIAVVRIILLRRNQESRQVSGERTRRAQREAEEANQNAARRARAQSTRVQSSKTRNRRAQPTGDTGSQVTVDELIRRSQERRQTVAQRQTERGVPFTPTPGPVVAPKPRPSTPEAQAPTDVGERRQAAPKRRISLDDDLYS